MRTILVVDLRTIIGIGLAVLVGLVVGGAYAWDAIRRWWWHRSPGIMEPLKAATRSDLKILAIDRGVAVRWWWPSWYIRRRVRFAFGIDWRGNAPWWWRWMARR